MSNPTAPPTALHVNDAAFTAVRMAKEAHRRGLKWDLRPLASPAREWRGVAGKVRKPVIAARWLGGLAMDARRHDIVHVHSATTLKHTRHAAPRFLLHCHGSDVRTAQYTPAQQGSVRTGLREAEAVFYSTPDLAEHVLPHRADAHYLPVPISVDEVPHWDPAGDPAVMFASRWSPEKDSERQLAIAAELVRALRGRARVVGLDWGPQAGEAAALGVHLVPFVDHAAYVSLLAGARVVIGQSAGILAASELEALASGAPLVVPVALPLYSGTGAPVATTETAAETADQVLALLGDGGDATLRREWVREHHGVVAAVDAVTTVYDAVLAARG